MCVGNPANLTAEARRKEPEARKRIAQSHKANRQGAELARLYRQQGHSTAAAIQREAENNSKRKVGGVCWLRL